MASLPQRVRGWLYGGLLGLALVAAPLAHADEDLIRTREVLEDPSASLRIDQVQQAAFTPFDDLFARGYTDSAFWFRLVVVPDPSGGAVKLRIRPTYLDEVQLYEPDARQPSGWSVRRTGDRMPFEASDRSTNALGLIVYPTAPATTYYLRLKTSSSSLLHVTALTLPQAEHRDGTLALLLIAYVCLVGWTTLWAIGNYLRERDTVSSGFAVFQLSNIFYGLCVMGFMAPLAPARWPGLIDGLTSLSVVVTVCLELLFNRTVFLLYRPVRVLRLLLWLLWPIAAVLLGLLASGHVRLALQSAVMLLFIGGLLFVVISLLLREEGPQLPRLSLLRKIYAVHFASIVCITLPLVARVPVHEWMLQVNLLPGLIGCGLMIYWLSMRARFQRQHIAAERARLGRVQYQLKVEKRQAEEQQQFIDMLTHEIKTPLSVALMSVGALKLDHPYIDRIQQALRNIDGIVDRTRLSDLAEHQGLTPRHAPLDLAALVADCCAASTSPERLKVLVGQPLTLLSDSQLLGIVLGNLIDNALKYAAPSSVVTVAIEAPPPGTKGVLLRVRNALGPVGAPDPARVFGKYYRSVQARGKSGSGLGLYLSRNIARLLGGTLDHAVQNDEVVFTLWLPV